MDILRGTLDVLTLTFNTPWLVSIILGLVISLVFTQWLKRHVLKNYRGTPGGRWFIRVILALPIAAIPTWFTWPTEHVHLRLWVSIAVGFGAWPLYDLWATIRNHYWPWLAVQVNRRKKAEGPLQPREDTQ